MQRTIAIARLVSTSACANPGIPFPEQSLLAEPIVSIVLECQSAVTTIDLTGLPPSGRAAAHGQDRGWQLQTGPKPANLTSSLRG